MLKWSAFNDNNQFLFLNDLLLGPIFIIIVLFFCNNYIKNKKNPIYKKYFINALIVRFASAIIMALIYQFYYEGGDTQTYYIYALRIREVFSESKSDFFYLMLRSSHEFDVLNRIFDTGAGFYTDHSSNFIIRLTVILCYFLLNTYILVSFVFSLFCFYGCWKIFTLFQQLYPHLEKEFAFACLFLPSVCFWGTGILKDPISLGALGMLTYHVYMLFFERKKTIGRIFIIIACFWILKIVKFYILLAFLPAYSFWIIYRLKETINSKFLRFLFGPVIFSIAIIIGGFVLYKIAAYSQRYSFESIIITAMDTQNWLYYSSLRDGGSGYSLGNIDFTPLGILKAAPKAINVSLFRPYIWEAKKIILIPAALEGLLSLFITIRLLYKAGFIRFLKIILTNPEVQFCLIFSLIFAFAVGFTSYNFGTLARYKIPLMPFYFIALFIIADKENKIELNEKSIPIKKKPLTNKPVLS